MPLIKFNHSVISSSQPSMMKTRRTYKLDVGVFPLGLNQVERCAKCHEHSVTSGMEQFNVMLGTVPFNSVASGMEQFNVMLGTVPHNSVISGMEQFNVMLGTVPQPLQQCSFVSLIRI